MNGTPEKARAVLNEKKYPVPSLHVGKRRLPRRVGKERAIAEEGEKRAGEEEGGGQENEGRLFILCN